MGKRKSHSKRSASRLPKGLPVKQGNSNANVNPFETVANHKRPKHDVHNRNNIRTSTSAITANRPSALAQALQKRKLAVKAEIESSKKANVFSDKRIGEYDSRMTAEDQKMARLVRERSKRSKRTTKYSLDDNDNNDNDKHVLTHKGKAIDKLSAADHVILSDDEELYGEDHQLDTDLHFGGGAFSDNAHSSYGPQGGKSMGMTELYSQRKTELDDLIMRRKVLKAERQKSKEEQVETFTSMDDSFKELAGLLQFRDKGKEARNETKANISGLSTKEDLEMAEWDREMKQFQFLERKVRATDRTKTPEEIAAEEAARLHKLETRRLARMSGDFENDNLTDISDDEEDDDDDDDDDDKKKKRAKKKSKDHPEALDNSDDEDDKKDELSVRFTSEGLVEVDKNGVIVRKVGQEAEGEEEEEDEDEDEDDEKETMAPSVMLKVGTRVSASYHAKEQFQGVESWFDGVISKVNMPSNGSSISFDVEYDDGDFEEGVEPRHIKALDQPAVEDCEKEAKNKLKRQKARTKARTEMPFVFEVPTTLEALHDLIARYASTGEEVSSIIRRIHSANSVRLDRRNSEKMQNFQDVLLRRFVAVGDAIYESGDGGTELGRYKQLDALTETMYSLAQDAPDSAAAVWSRRLGFFLNAHAKRLRDSELEQEDEDNDGEQLKTAWPSTGVFMTLRALGHIFPVTDRRHNVVTPSLLLLGQFIAHTPIQSTYDLVMGTMCSALLIEYTKESKRFVPEALAFFAGVIRLFAPQLAKRPELFALPSLGVAASQEPFLSLRSNATSFKGKTLPLLSLYQGDIEKEVGVGVLTAVLQLVDVVATTVAGSLASAEAECFSEITKSLLDLEPKSKKDSFPQLMQKKIAATVSAVADACRLDSPRLPLQRRPNPTARDTAVKSLAPRLESPAKYSFSKDRGKNATQAALDRTRRELKREHKAVSRELRLDAAMVEEGRREDKEKKDSGARAKRHKALVWLEGEQAAMNQQVRQGGGLLQGGGTGAARAKARTGKLGMKKGGKLK